MERFVRVQSNKHCRDISVKIVRTSQARERFIHHPFSHFGQVSIVVLSGEETSPGMSLPVAGLSEAV